MNETIHDVNAIIVDTNHDCEGNSIGLTGQIVIDAFTITPHRWEDVNGS